MASALSVAGSSIAAPAKGLSSSSPRTWNEGSLRSLSLKGKAAPSLAHAKATPQKGRQPFVVKAVKTLVDVNEADNVKFASLVSRRIVYGHEEWRKHKSASRYFRNIKTIPSSKVVAAIGPPIALMAGLSSFVVGWNNLVLQNLLPAWAPVLHMSNLPFSLTAPALAFLLVFRTNSSYGRFDEARKMWGLCLNRCRDIARQALTYMARDQYTYEYPKRAQFLRHVQAFPLAYKHHFLNEGSLEDDLREFTSLSDDEIQGVLEATHRPNYVLQMMSECMGRCHMDPIHRVGMETNFATFADDIGGCERLFKTPIPLSYTRLTSRFLVLYHMFLPFALYDVLGWVTIPVTIAHTFVFFCIEEVGVLIENPFPILALDAIAASARNNVAELVSLHEGIRNRVVDDDEEFKQLSAASQQALLPKEKAYVPAPEPEYLSDWDEDAAGLTDSQVLTAIAAPSIDKSIVVTVKGTVKGPYSDDL